MMICGLSQKYLEKKLELGKDATLLISDGDLLDMRTSNVTRAFIKGAEIDLDNKQKELYRLYSEKYNLK